MTSKLCLNKEDKAVMQEAMKVILGIYNQRENLTHEDSFKVLDRTYKLKPGVWAPLVYKPDSPSKLGDVFDDGRSRWMVMMQEKGGVNFKDTNVLEIGGGSGVNGIEAVLHYGAKSATMVDISPVAVENCLMNVKEHGLSDKIKCYSSDIYKSVPKENQFDIVMWFGSPCNTEYVEENANLSHLVTDQSGVEWNLLRRFVKESRPHLTKKGRLYNVLIRADVREGLKLEDIAREIANDEGFDMNVLCDFDTNLLTVGGGAEVRDKDKSYIIDKVDCPVPFRAYTYVALIEFIPK